MIYIIHSGKRTNACKSCPRLLIASKSVIVMNRWINLNPGRVKGDVAVILHERLLELEKSEGGERF